MNILFFLTPKAMCANIDADDTIREAMGRMESSGFTALPVLDKNGGYCGVLTEGDLLWALKRLCVMDMRQTEEHHISEITPRRNIRPVKVDTRIEDLISVAAEQNFVPVIDDKGAFIGIVTRSSIMKFMQQKYLEQA
ncbi:MAG: CBS domain-containing protein [Oscillospiraceae bacterium]|nr:CBS domain-containing protein [Oscillospiraceae bacterium]MBQ5748833.1 CBS domain-containing protein [Oscillospiraceae bacterium]